MQLQSKKKIWINIYHRIIYVSEQQLTGTRLLEVLEKLLATLFTELVVSRPAFDIMRKLGFRKSCDSYLALYIKNI
jgi:hypothetical protein